MPTEHKIENTIKSKILIPITPYPEQISKAVAIIYTGGTIGMVKDENNQLKADPSYIFKTMSSTPIFQHEQMPPFMLYSMPEIFDSSKMNPGDWVKIATAVYEIYEHFRAFVIIHGTDTLAYTASALSFIFENLQKHVVLTASQLPLSSPYSDGYFNLAGAMLTASQLQIPEVTVFFANKLMRGNRVQKFSSWALDAFDCTQMQPLAEFGTSLNFRRQLVRNFTEPNYANSDFNVAEICYDIGMIYLVPGLKPEALEGFKQCKGLVLQVFGAGNGGDDEICAKLKQLHDSGCVIGLVSQTHSSMISVGAYQASNSLRDAGCISSMGMTPEAAYTKLAYLTGQKMTQKEIEEQFSGMNLRGERE